MTSRRKWARWVAAAMALATVAVVTLLLIIGREGDTAVERWIGEQIVAVLEASTTTTTRFTALDYRAPATVVVTGLTLSSGDVEMVASDRLLLELAETPSIGKPIQIERIEIDAPRLHFVRAADGGFVGWSGFVRPGALADHKVAQEGRRLSDVLVLRHVEIRDGRLIYDASDGSEPMILRGITTSLDTVPDAADPGWYTLTGALRRAPFFEADIDARLNLDTAVIEAKELALSVKLDETQYEVFPPALQTTLRKHEVRGDLSVRLQGAVPLRQWETGALNLAATLRGGRVAFGENVLPIDELNLRGDLTDAILKVDLDARLLGGEMELHAASGLTGSRPVNLTWSVTGTKIERTLRALTGGPPRYAGTIRSRGRLTADLADWPNACGGKGGVDVEEGRLILLPGIEDLLQLIGVSALGDGKPARDRAKIRFDFQPGGIRIDKGTLTSQFFSARFHGTIDFAGVMDLDVNAGPLEKVQSLLGKTGKWLGQLSDKIVTYRIHGPVSQPKVSIKPLTLDFRD